MLARNAGGMGDAAVFSTAVLEAVSAVAVAARPAGSDRDWSVNAGTLEWSCTRTADHAVDTVLAPAFFLASRKLDGDPKLGGSDFTVGADATPPDLIEGLATATRTLVAVPMTCAAALACHSSRPPTCAIGCVSTRSPGPCGTAPGTNSEPATTRGRTCWSARADIRRPDRNGP